MEEIWNLPFWSREGLGGVAHTWSTKVIYDLSALLSLGCLVPNLHLAFSCTEWLLYLDVGVWAFVWQEVLPHDWMQQKDSLIITNGIFTKQQAQLPFQRHIRSLHFLFLFFLNNSKENIVAPIGLLSSLLFIHVDSENIDYWIKIT